MARRTRQFQTRTKSGLKKPPTKPKPENKEERAESQVQHKAKSERKEGNNHSNSHTRRKKATRSNTRGHHEKTGCHGVKEYLLPTARFPDKTPITALNEPGSASTQFSDTAAMGQPTTMVADPISNVTINKKKQLNVPQTSEREKRQLKIGTWNVRRGLITRDIEIKELMKSENIDVMFLTETDTKQINAEKYKLVGFNTIAQACEGDEDVVRIVAIIKDDPSLGFKVRQDLMSKTFPSIWLEVFDKYKQSTIVGGFYRQWAEKGERLSVPEQVHQIEEFCQQINNANRSSDKVIILGDANLCAEKWDEENYKRKSVAQPLIQCLSQNGLDINTVGVTFQADHSANGKVAESALDHAYTSITIRNTTTIRKIQNSSSDHLPVLVDYKLDLKKSKYTHSVTKRSFKNFNKDTWNSALEEQDWLDVEESEGVHHMVDVFDRNIQAALDIVAPVRTFKIRSNHRFGLSDETKELMRKRDQTRRSISGAAAKEKNVLLKQYKSLRNRVTSKIRKENVDYNNNRIEEAANEKELWNIANDVMNPRKESDWKIIDDEGKEITEERDVAETFNRFFVEKVEDLKRGIDKTLIEDPLQRLKERMKNNACTMEFKTVSQKQLKTHLKKLKKKKSSGIDGLSQEHLILGATKLLTPLATIINQSILEGEFPNGWKEALVTPVLKKGCNTKLGNYRPVSCLPAASKLLEIVVCDQLSKYLELNNLLPENQHGFRPRRSTMTAWQDIQLDWAMKGEKKLITGVLLWDLSAAFDTLDCEGACAKLKVFGLQERSVRWVRSFLTDRTQRVKINGAISSARKVPSGVPQGGVLSPLVFVLFVSDLQDWLTHSTAPTYADDTTTGTSGRNVEETVALMEEDASMVLKYMASNGLVANSSKTSFLLLNSGTSDYEVTVKIGEDRVKREDSAKLLGIQFQDNLQWKNQIFGKGGLISSLNSRLYIVRRLKSHLSLRNVLKVVDGIFTSKIRYGLQLIGKARTKREDAVCADLWAIQLVQNKLLRLLNKTQVKDGVSTASMLKKFEMLSVNQLNVQVKLMEVWKSQKIKDYPLKIAKQSIEENICTTRASTQGKLIGIGKTTTTQNTSTSDAIRIWNMAPKEITECISVWQAKEKIKAYAKSLPI